MDFTTLEPWWQSESESGLDCFIFMISHSGSGFEQSERRRRREPDFSFVHAALLGLTDPVGEQHKKMILKRRSSCICAEHFFLERGELTVATFRDDHTIRLCHPRTTHFRIFFGWQSIDHSQA